MSDYFSLKAIKKLKLKNVGKNVKISETCKFYGSEFIEIKDNVRIDAYTVITAGPELVKIGSYVHIGVNCYIHGRFGIHFRDYSAISSGTRVYSSSDDFSGGYMTNPTIPRKFVKPFEKKVVIGKFVNVGSNAVIMPGSVLEEGCVVGALSFVNKKKLNKWTIYFGSPVIALLKRKKNILNLEKKLKKEIHEKI